MTARGGDGDDDDDDDEEEGGDDGGAAMEDVPEEEDGRSEKDDKVTDRSDESDGNTVKRDVRVAVAKNEDSRKKREEIESAADLDGRNGTGKGDGESDEEECIPPALPPRPPPRSRQPACSCTCDFPDGETELRRGLHRTPSRSCWSSGLRKYVFLCTACGSLSILLGTLFLFVYFMLKSYTSSLNHFETIPTYVPSGMLIATGFLIICLACRKNRNSFLMKLCGLCSLCCAVLCVSVTVTTTVIHMNRLQTLRECLYTQKTQSCTCYSVLMDNDRAADEGIKFVFNSTPDCEVVHGALYSCLRAIFGLSVIGILVCIFSCMLVYQLLSHEKKKMYWAQLEMRCRYLYRQQRNPHYCSCCDECRYPPPPPPHEIFPWELMGNRFWSSGRIGNLYTPNPEDRDGSSRLRSGWNWRRLPWNRSGSSANEPSRANLGSPDSQYGFSSTPTVDGAPYTVLDPRTSNCSASVPPGTDITEGGFYSWGPPPPYASNRNSANNSPARRSLGEILHQVSPIRRNDNVSPIRPYHHVHHHHVHHPHSGNHQCASSTRQVPAPAGATQPNCLQKSTPPRPAQATDVLQQQRSGMESNPRSNSLTSVHRLQKFDQGKDDYENMYESEANFPPSTNGFNTLPSLKKRNQNRASELFQNETTSAYYFSSAENLGCSESNTANEGTFRNENLPPRVFLVNDASRGSTPRHGDAGVYPKHQPKNGSVEPELQGELHASRSSNESGVLSPQTCNRSVRTPENGNSFVKKLFVSCSPTKQKHAGIDGEQPVSNADKRESLAHANKKKVGKRLAPAKESDSANENVITFHYRLGIPRSPNIHNFGQFAEKSLKICDGGGKEECGAEQWGGESQGGAAEEPRDSQKVLKGFKYVSKDVDLLQKHGSLMKEFNKNVDLQKNLKCKSEKTTARAAYGGVDNKAFQNAEDCPRSLLTRPHSEAKHASVICHPPSEFRGKPGRMDLGQSETEQGEDYQMGNAKNENESDVYFGDISNSSCYVSVQNEGGDSSLYEEAVESRSGTSFQSGPGQSLLSKQNLKRIEDESAGYNEIALEYEHSDNSTYSKLQEDAEGFQQGHRSRGSRAGAFRYLAQEEAKKDESRPGPSELKPPEPFAKPVRSFLVSSNYGDLDGKNKYFNLGGCYQDHYREASNSNDEHSSSSLTVDSGISTGRNYLPRCYDAGYQELDCAGKVATDAADSRTEACFETLNERFSNMEKFQPCKISNLDNLSEFSHPLFQKPKVIPRGNRYKEGQKKPGKTEADKEQENEAEGRKQRTTSFAKKSSDAGDAAQFQNEGDCVDARFEHSKSKGDDGYQKSKPEEAFGKSPKPLPRTTVSGGAVVEGVSHGKHAKYGTSKEKHFLAPDAQYEYKDNYRAEFKQKGQGKKGGADGGKPTVPARPLNLQERCRNVKVDAFLGYCKNEGNCPVPRRRQPRGLDELPDKEGGEMGSHSVNV